MIKGSFIFVMLGLCLGLAVAKDISGGPSTGPSGTTCVNSGKCTGKPDGTLFADPNTTGYIVCQCECEIAMPCAPGTAFSEKLHTCDHIGCGNGSGDCGSGGDGNNGGGNNGGGSTGGGSTGGGNNGGGSSGPSTGPSGTTCVNSGKCKGKPDGTLFADPNTTGYIVCQCECEIAMPCAPGTAFSEKLQTCDHIGCGNGSGDCGSGGDGNNGSGNNGGGSTGGGSNGGGSSGPSTGPSGTTCVNSGKCRGKPDGTLFADPNTTGYIVCQCECEIAMPCAPGTAFSEKLQTCDHIGCGNGSGDCGSGGDGNNGGGSTGGGSTGGGSTGGGNNGGGSSGPSTGPSGTTCVNSGKCKGKPDGTLFADPNTTGYIVCQCECEIAMPCAPGTAFSEKLQTCDHIGCGNGSGDCGSGGDGNNGSGNNGGGSSGGGNNGGGSSGPSTGPSGTTCVNSGKCKGKPDGTLFADPNTTGYIVCQCECEIAMPCAPGTAFSEKLQTCDHIGCGNGSGDCGSGGDDNNGGGSTGGGSTGGGSTGGGNNGGGSSGPSTGPSGTTCVNSGKCVGQPDGKLFADPNSTGYIVCQCECEIAMSCAPGTAFNEALQTCDHIGCGKNGKCFTGN